VWNLDTVDSTTDWYSVNTTDGSLKIYFVSVWHDIFGTVFATKIPCQIFAFFGTEVAHRRKLLLHKHLRRAGRALLVVNPCHIMI